MIVLFSLQKLDDKLFVFPGHIEGEAKFINEITRQDANYLIPEYVTRLLSRNVNIELTGIDQSNACHAIYTASRSSFRGGVSFGFWRARVLASFSNSRSSRTYSMEATSNGLRISLPGVIGYYTQIMPKFPNNKS